MPARPFSSSRLVPLALAILIPALAAAALAGQGKPPVATPGKVVEFQGMCDASGAVVVGSNRFVVADDEDNILRVYDAERGGAPLFGVDVSPALDLPQKKKAPEADLEAATRVGDLALWLTSHGRNSKGKKQPSRLRFFGTSVPEDGKPLVIEGKPYTDLLEDLLAAPSLAAFHLREAEALAPKAPGGLNLEGMTARPDGKSVLLGFRNPLPKQRAIVIPLLNPLELLRGEKARFGEAVLLDLEGRGVRSISFWRGRYLLAAGGIDAEKTSALFSWDGKSDPQRIQVPNLEGFNPEAFASFADRPEIMLLSDDGSRQVEGKDCKKLKDPSKKRFRGLWLRLP